MLTSAVLASVRMDRCTRKEFATIAGLRQEVITRWEQRQNCRVNRLVKELANDPEQAVARLRRFAWGCDWLVEAWHDLLEALGQGTWDANAALRLAGSADPTLRLDALALQAPVDPDAVDACTGTDTRHLDPEARQHAARAQLPDPAAARERWKARIEQAVVELNRLRDTLWREHDGPRLARAIDLATFDDTPEGALYRRYHQASTLEFHRCLNQMRQHRKQAASGPHPPGLPDPEEAQRLMARAAQQVFPQPTAEPEALAEPVLNQAAAPFRPEPSSAPAPEPQVAEAPCSSVTAAGMASPPQTPVSPASSEASASARPRAPTAEERWAEARRLGQSV